MRILPWGISPWILPLTSEDTAHTRHWAEGGLRNVLSLDRWLWLRKEEVFGNSSLGAGLRCTQPLLFSQPGLWEAPSGSPAARGTKMLQNQEDPGKGPAPFPPSVASLSLLHPSCLGMLAACPGCWPRMCLGAFGLQGAFAVLSHRSGAQKMHL